MIEKEVKHMRGLAKVLDTLANEVEEKGKFDDEDLDLLKKIGSDVLFKGVAIVFTEK